ncbi:MAG: polysaccharide deacetylase family protein [Ginsengibacter sp.]
MKNESNRLLVFTFHGLFKSEEEMKLNHIDPQTNMTLDQFVRFIEYFLKNKYKFILPEELSSERNKNHPCAIITFDDGYYNNILAIEILNKYKIPGVFFISTKNVLENISYWWDIIYKYRIKEGRTIDEIRNEQNNLKTLKQESIDLYILENFGKESTTPWSDIDRPFTPDEIKHLSNNPLVSFGNHTHSHAILTNYNLEEIKAELKACNSILQNLTGVIPTTIAYPNGNYNEVVIQASKEENFKFGFNIAGKTNILPLDHGNFTCLNRYITNTTEISRFGGFCRLDYKPQELYNHWVKRARNIFGIY